MSSTDIQLSTIRTDCWEALYNHLQTGDYAISTDNIFSSLNESLISEKGYPMVEIEPPTIGSVKLTLNREIKGCTVTFTIKVYHDSSKELKVLADEVHNQIESGWKILSSAGLNRPDFPEGDYDWYTEGKKKIHISIISIIFKYVGK